jgi:hypothetical protein
MLRSLPLIDSLVSAFSAIAPTQPENCIYLLAASEEGAGLVTTNMHRPPKKDWLPVMQHANKYSGIV